MRPSAKATNKKQADKMQLQYFVTPSGAGSKGL